MNCCAGRARPGVGTAADLADYFRMKVGEARPRIAELVEAGDLREVQVEGWREAAYRARDPSVRSRAGAIDARALLSPFDPLIWFRPGRSRLFHFDYRFEIFVPKAKRKWGSYVLPFLMETAWRAFDVKADRQETACSSRAPTWSPGPRRRGCAGPRGRASTLAGWLGSMTSALAGGDALRAAQERHGVGRLGRRLLAKRTPAMSRSCPASPPLACRQNRYSVDNGEAPVRHQLMTLTSGQAEKPRSHEPVPARSLCPGRGLPLRSCPWRYARSSG